MSSINVLNVAVLDNPAPFLSPLKFEITFECISPLADDLEWKLTYVGSAERKECDQVLENIVLGPVAVGSYRFTLLAKAPDVSRIPRSDLIGVTVVLLSCFYRQQEFIRVGYYVNNAYPPTEDAAAPASASAAPQAAPTSGQSALSEKGNSQPLPDPSASWPDPHQPEKITRAILADNPRVTLFPIYWDAEAERREKEQLAKESAGEAMDEGDDEDEVDEEDEDEEDEEDDEEGEEGYRSNEEMTDAFQSEELDDDEDMDAL